MTWRSDDCVESHDDPFVYVSRNITKGVCIIYIYIYNS